MVVFCVFVLWIMCSKPWDDTECTDKKRNTQLRSCFSTSSLNGLINRDLKIFVLNQYHYKFCGEVREWLNRTVSKIVVP